MSRKERLDNTVATNGDIVMHESSPGDRDVVFARVRQVIGKGSAVVENLKDKEIVYEIRLFDLRVLVRKTNTKQNS